MGNHYKGEIPKNSNSSSNNNNNNNNNRKEGGTIWNLMGETAAHQRGDLFLASNGCSAWSKITRHDL